MSSLIERYSNKRVSFSFHGEALFFDLSQGLFSSFDIDTGTKLLLKTVASQVDLGDVTRIADIGCGTGVLGTAVARKCTGSTCLFQDRDALALEFAVSNSELNGIGDRSEFFGGLGLREIGDGSFDLILSNLPAKAGRPVLSRIIGEMADHLTENGTACVVVVTPLADDICEIINSQSGKILYTEEGREHRVYHFRRAGRPVKPRAEGDYLEAYIRNRGRFAGCGVSYNLETANNLPDFDTIGRDTALLMELIDKRIDPRFFEAQTGTMMIWNPGQGHLPVFLTRFFPDLSPEEIILVSRDDLQLAISSRNLTASLKKRDIEGASANPPKTYHLAAMDQFCSKAAPASVSLALILPRPVPGAGWENEASRLIDRIIAPGGIVAACAGSTVIHRFLSRLHGMVLQGSRKYHGSRAVLLKKQKHD